MSNPTANPPFSERDREAWDALSFEEQCKRDDRAQAFAGISRALTLYTLTVNEIMRRILVEDADADALANMLMNAEVAMQAEGTRARSEIVKALNTIAVQNGQTNVIDPEAWLQTVRARRHTERRRRMN